MATGQDQSAPSDKIHSLLVIMVRIMKRRRMIMVILMMMRIMRMRRMIMVITVTNSTKRLKDYNLTE